MVAVADRVEVQVLVDNVTDHLSTNPPGVTGERAVLLEAGLAEQAGEHICSAHHGLSLVVTAWAGTRRRTVLFDAGPEGYAVERNGARLGVDFGAVEAVVLSHGHWDHAGGLPAALERIRAASGRLTPCYVHPGMFRQRGTRLPDGAVLPQRPVPDVAALAAAGAAVVNTADPQVLLDGLFSLSGEIPRVTPYEAGMPAEHVRRTEAGAGWEHDRWVRDERFLTVRVRDKGLVVFTACSHAGVVNVLTHARALVPDAKVHAVMGGFHLSGRAFEAIIPDTVRGLEAVGPAMIAPAHCTGWRAVTALVNAFGEGVVVPAAVGKRYAF